MDKPKEQLWEKLVADKFGHLIPEKLKQLEGLYFLAMDQRRSSSVYANELWSRIDPDLWDRFRNPWMIIQSLSLKKLNQLTDDKAFMEVYQKSYDRQRAMVGVKGWFNQTYGQAPLKHIAYFSMEFGISEALPIYSGGLGILAGDHLKTACDLDVPITGIGLLYQQGYFRQYITPDGHQIEVYPYNDPNQLPILRSRNERGELLNVEIDFPGRTIRFRVWEVYVGRIKLYLLDSNDATNTALDRGITSSLYGGSTEHRLTQEIVLGIGGWKVLEAIGISPEVCHLNEGHAAFVVFARIQSFMKQNDVSFEKALAITRSGNLFTTHTPVSAGFDRFDPELITKYFSEMAASLNVDINDLLGLGRENAQDSNELFNMAYLAFRGSGAVNGVSKLHGEVSKKLFAPLFPRWPIDEIPVGYVTNGIHIPSWESAEADKVWSKLVDGDTRWWLNLDGIEKKFSKVTDEDIWSLRTVARSHLVEYVRAHLALQRKIRGRTEAEIRQAETVFDPNVLTIGFARRFATYKRVNLLLHDKERLLRLISNTTRPIQIVVAGKAHPQDGPGKAMIAEWVQFVQQENVRARIIFLADYDILMAERLVHGVDVWLNMPRRPMEASGTSGMKLLANGGLNLSELDGWWAEAYSPDVGWALGDGKEHGADQGWDQYEAESLFKILEQQVIPTFYNRDAKGLPREWLKLIRNSMSKLAPRFSTTRMMHDYVKQYYLPAAESYLQRAAKHGAKGIQLQDWCKNLHDRWKSAQFSDLQVKESHGKYLFEVQLQLGELDPNEVLVEIYANSQNGEKPFHQVMKCRGKVDRSESTYLFELHLSKERSPEDYTARVIPAHQGISVPIEAPEILWQH